MKRRAPKPMPISEHKALRETFRAWSKGKGKATATPSPWNRRDRRKGKP